MKPYDYDTILAAWETYPSIHIRYSSDESGWARQLSPTEACLDNVSFSGQYGIYDIVTLVQTRSGKPRIGRILQRRYGQVALVHYPVGKDMDETKKRYKQLCAKAEAADGVCEGAVAGIAILNLPSGVDAQTVVGKTGYVKHQHALD